MKKAVSALLLTSLIAGPLLLNPREAQAHRSEGTFAVGLAVVLVIGLASSHHHKKEPATAAISGNSRFFVKNPTPLEVHTASNALLQTAK